MRIYIKTTPNHSVVPFDYQQKLIGTIHKWLGNNDIHDNISLYSFSWLIGGKIIDGSGFVFPDGARFFVSFYEKEYLKLLMKTILDDPEMFCGLSVREISLGEEPLFSAEPQYFRLASPVFIKRYHNDERDWKFYFYDDEESSKFMTETLKHKMQVAGLPEDKSLKVVFDKSYLGKSIKMVTIHGIKSKASMCPVIVYGSPESKLFAWTVGIGNSTGSAFGALL